MQLWWMEAAFLHASDWLCCAGKGRLDSVASAKLSDPDLSETQD